MLNGSTGKTRTASKTAPPSRRLDPGGDEDEVGTEAEEEAEQDAPGHERLRGEDTADVQELHHDVEDRAGGERKEQDRNGLADPELADERAEEGRGTADEAEQAEEAPARLLLVAGERRADPKPFRCVVEAEADDQHDREADLIRGGRLADRQAFGEVVQTDARRDEDREPARRRHPRE